MTRVIAKIAGKTWWVGSVKACYAPAMIFSRAALSKNAERLRPRALAAASIASLLLVTTSPPPRRSTAQRPGSTGGDGERRSSLRAVVTDEAIVTSTADIGPTFRPETFDDF